MLVLKYASTWDERWLAHNFVAKRYHEHGYIPDPNDLREMPQFQIVAMREGVEIVGSIGLHAYSSAVELPVDHFFRFAKPTVAETLGMEANSIAEVSRLTSVAGPRCSVALFSGVLEFMEATARGEGMIVATVRPQLFTHLRDHYGFAVHRVPAHVRRSAVPETYQSYFCPESEKMAPVVMKLSVRDLKERLSLLTGREDRGFISLGIRQPPAVPGVLNTALRAASG